MLHWPTLSLCPLLLRPAMVCCAGVFIVLPPDVSAAAAMAKRAVVATLLRATGCVELYTATCRAFATEGSPVVPPPDELVSVWATSMAAVYTLFHALLSPPWTRQSRQHAAMQLARRVAHNCSFLRLLQLDGSPCAVLRPNVIGFVTAASMRCVTVRGF